MAFIGVAAFIGQNTRQQTADGINDCERGDFTAGQNEIADGDFLVNAFVDKALVNALIVAVGRRKNEDVEQTFVNLEQIWSEYGVYEKVEE